MSTISGGSCFRFALTTILWMSADQISGIKWITNSMYIVTWTALSKERGPNIFESRRKSNVLGIFNKEKETSQAWRHEKESFPGPVLQPTLPTMYSRKSVFRENSTMSRYWATISLYQVPRKSGSNYETGQQLEISSFSSISTNQGVSNIPIQKMFYP